MKTSINDNSVKAINNNARPQNTKLNILCVDDEVFNLEILTKSLDKINCTSVCAENGEDALKILRKNPDKFDAILLDKMMPGMSGIEVINIIKKNAALKDIPVIMQTAAISEKEIIEGIQSGAYYYLTKPYSSEMLISIVMSATREYHEAQQIKNRLAKNTSIISLATSGEFEFRTMKEARELAWFLSGFSTTPSRSVVALSALLSNAVEHGNLEIGHERKIELIAVGQLDNEIFRRLSLPEYENRKVHVSFIRTIDEIKITIKDQGAGFNWHEYVDFEPTRMTNSNGRGIAMAHVISHNSIEFTGTGSEVIYKIAL